MKTKTILKKILVPLCFFALGSSVTLAGVVTPVVAYLTDSQGNPYGAGTNVTITAWPATNVISGVGTNLVANLPIVDVTSAGGEISNNLAPGNYRMQIAGFPRGITFGVVSNGTALNVSQLAGVPVPEFLNFTIAQFSDAGTMARESTNNWTRNSYVAVSNAVGFVIATNGGPVAVSQLPYTPATNSYAGVSNAVGFVIATNGGPVAVAQLPYVPATNSYAGVSNAVGFVIATNGGPVAVTQLPYLPATNGGSISNYQLSTNVLTSFGFGPVSFTTNYGVMWAVFQTNGPMGNTLTNLPSGSICTTTNGQFFVLSNAVWLVK
jgi:hypothetical protein